MTLTPTTRTGEAHREGEDERDVNMTRIYVGVVLVQVVTILGLLLLEFVYTR